MSNNGIETLGCLIPGVEVMGGFRVLQSDEDISTPEPPLQGNGYEPGRTNIVHLAVTSQMATELWGDHSGQFFDGPCTD